MSRGAFLKNLLTRLADRLILRPSKDWVDPEGRRREIISTPHGLVEAWVVTNEAKPKGCDSDSPASGSQPELKVYDGTTSGRPQMIALKFPGVAGRAERGGPHPFELIPEFRAEIWTINPLGYGGSEGRASLSTTAATCDAIWSLFERRFPQTPIFVIGNSLGCLSALYMAATKPVAGVYLRNPVPIQQMIRSRWKYNWWNLGMAAWIAYQIPTELDAVENAKRCLSPLLLISSEKDRVVPVRYQDLIWAAYGGGKRRLILSGVDHHEPVPEAQQREYSAAVILFLQNIIQASGDLSAGN